MTVDEKWKAVVQNNAAYDGRFYYAVQSTGIFCRPSCKSRLPNKENVSFYDTRNDAAKAGFRPCKRCRPDLLEYQPVKDIADKTKQLIDDYFLAKKKLDEEFKRLGITSHHISRIFKEQYGYTPSEYIMKLRIRDAKVRLIETNEDIIDIAYSIGFNSISSFYRLFRKHTGRSPARYRKEYNGQKSEVEK